MKTKVFFVNQKCSKCEFSKLDSCECPFYPKETIKDALLDDVRADFCRIRRVFVEEITSLDETNLD